MGAYCLLRQDFVLDYDNCKIIRRDQTGDCRCFLVPAYMWADEYLGLKRKDYDYLQTHTMEHAGYCYMRASRMKLKDLEVYINTEISADVVSPVSKIVFNFRGKENCITVNAKALMGWGRSSNVEHVVDVNGITKRYKNDLDLTYDENDISMFSPVMGVCYSRLKNSGLTKFPFGLRRSQYRIVYHGKWIDGTCYAMLCGTYAVLLNDDLSFHSLGLLCGCTTEALNISRFIYTTNTFISKLMTLLK